MKLQAARNRRRFHFVLQESIPTVHFFTSSVKFIQVQVEVSEQPMGRSEIRMIVGRFSFPITSITKKGSLVTPIPFQYELATRTYESSPVLRASSRMPSWLNESGLTQHLIACFSNMIAVSWARSFVVMIVIIGCGRWAQLVTMVSRQSSALRRKEDPMSRSIFTMHLRAIAKIRSTEDRPPAIFRRVVLRRFYGIRSSNIRTHLLGLRP